MHRGVDFAAPIGTPIHAATDGVVAEAGPASGFGNWIVLDTTMDDKKVSTVYGHMFDDGVLVHKGDKVTAGQVIGKVGNAGGSTGPHLHFEVWPGGRDGGASTDPEQWLGGATPASPGGVVLAASVTSTSGSDLSQPTPASAGSEEHMQVDARRLMRALHQHFGERIAQLGGWRADGGGVDDHPDGRAIDAMIPDPTSGTGIAAGDAVRDWVLANAQFFHVVYVIWRQTYYEPGQPGSGMEDRGDPTANHMDHVHITVVGGGANTAGAVWGSVPGGADPAPYATGCGTPPDGGAGLNTAELVRKYPNAVAFVPWIEKAATTCPEVTAPLLAAQLENESGFDVNAHNAGSGADGPAQFVPGTWASKAVDGDGDGDKETRSVPDALMSQAAYDCELVGVAKKGLAAGTLHGELTELWLSMYNCGDGATMESGGVCGNTETQNYVRNIAARSLVFSAPNPAPQVGITPGGPVGANIVAAAMRWLGSPYVWGGGDPQGPTRGEGSNEPGFDCSGLVLHAVAVATGGRVVLPHQSVAQLNDARGQSIPFASAAAGDIMFPAGGEPGHVVIYAGDGNIVEAPTFGDVVKVSPVSVLGENPSVRRFG